MSESDSRSIREILQRRAAGVVRGIRQQGAAVSKSLPRSRGLVRGMFVGVGLVVLVAVSMYVGRLTSPPQAAAAQEPQEASQGASADAEAAEAETGAEHGHGGQGDRNPYLVVPEDIEPWSTETTYTAPDGTPFTIHVELEKPTTAGMGMCTVGPAAANYNRTVVLSIRNDGDAAVTGPQIAVKDKRIAFPHAEGMGCSWTYPQDADGEYEPGDAKTFRGLLVTEPVDQDVVLTVLPGNTQEVLRIPTAAFAD